MSLIHAIYVKTVKLSFSLYQPFGIGPFNPHLPVGYIQNFKNYIFFGPFQNNFVSYSFIYQ